jgi:hypothetical protein
MGKNTILLVEDNPDDELLAIRALKKNNIMNKVVVARDGAEGLDYLFGAGAYSGLNSFHCQSLLYANRKKCRKRQSRKKALPCNLILRYIFLLPESFTIV